MGLVRPTAVVRIRRLAELHRPLIAIEGGLCGLRTYEATLHFLSYIYSVEDSNMRVSLPAVAFALVNLAYAQDLSKPVDYTTRAKPFAAIAAELKKQTGVDLECAPSLEREPLILRLKQVPLKDAMDRIADVFGGEWKQHDKSFELVRGDKADRLHQMALESDAMLVAASLKETAKSGGLSEPYTQQQAQDQVAKFAQANAGPETDWNLIKVVRDESPATRLLIRILLRIDPRRIATATWRHPLVFSNAPTNLEEALPNNVNEPVDQFLQEQAVLNQAASGQQGQGQTLAASSPGPVGKLLLTVAGNHGYYSFGLLVMDTTGTVMCHGSSDASRSAVKDHFAKMQALLKRPQDGVKLGPIAIDILPNIGNRENFHEVSAATRAVLSAPLQTDPLAIATSDVVLGLADKDGVNVAFLPPDSCEDWIYGIGKSGKVTLEALEEIALFSRQLTVSEEGGWLIGKPVDPLNTTQERLPRQALETFLSGIQSSQSFSVEARSRFEMEADPDSNKALASDALQPLYNWQYPDPQMNESEGCLALFATLNETQRKAAKAGTLKVSAIDFNRQQVTFLEDWLLPYGNTFISDQFVSHLIGKPMTLDLLGEPTEVLGSGFPAGSHLEVEDRTKYMFTFRMNTPEGPTDFGASLDDIARYGAEAERPDLFPKVLTYNLNAIRLGASRNVAVKFIVPGWHEDQQFMESSDRPTPVGPIDKVLDQLPGEVRSTYTDALEKYRDQIRKGTLKPSG